MNKVEMLVAHLTAEQLNWKVIDWARARNIVANKSMTVEFYPYPISSGKDLQEFRTAQFTKLQEEVDELKQAIEADDYAEIVDAIGDIMVCLSIQADSIEYTLTECFAEAYNEIKDRKGKMVDGVFVKDAEDN